PRYIPKRLNTASASSSPARPASKTFSDVKPSHFNLDSGNIDNPSLVMRTIAVAEANNSRQPVLPHLHFNPLNGSTAVCPISPAEPCEPRQSFPSRITPPPTPVPRVTLTTSRHPRAAPSHISPTAAALASFSRNTGQPSLFCNSVLSA